MISLPGETEARLNTALQQRDRWRQEAARRQVNLDRARDEIQTTNAVALAHADTIADLDSRIMAAQAEIDTFNALLEAGRFDEVRPTDILDRIKKALEGEKNDA